MTVPYVQMLADRAVAALDAKPRILITLAGIPGSGKSTTAELVAEELRRRGIPTTVVPMDGYHYTRQDLVRRIGAENARKFRGAPYTFDAQGVVELSRKLAHTEPVNFPTFDHALKDPVENGGYVPSETRVVILEGNYVQLADKPWSDIDAADTWFVHCDKPEARERLARRHVRSGIVSTIAEGEHRADSNDLANGDYIIAHSVPASCVVDSSAS